MTLNQKSILALCLSSLLAACGSDEAPTAPETIKAPQLTPAPDKKVSLLVGGSNVQAMRESVLITDTTNNEALVSIETFKGIEYATASRLEHSEVLALGSDVDATEYGYACPQLKSTSQPQSESCLNMNIWRPAGTQEGDDLPVYLFIHGGDFEYGSGSDVLIQGDTVVAQGANDAQPFIAITFNYRLGLLGSHWVKGENVDGNYGIGDQHTALQWVNQNIEAFGGNTQNVTLMGQGAGAMSISLLQQQAALQGEVGDYFQRAIMQSNPEGFEYESYGVAKDREYDIAPSTASLEEVLSAQSELLNPVSRLEDWLVKSVLPLSPIKLGSADNTPLAALMPFAPYRQCENIDFVGRCSQDAAQPFESDFMVPTVIGVNAKESNTMSMLPTLTFLIPKIIDMIGEEKPDLLANGDKEAWLIEMQQWLMVDENKQVLEVELSNAVSRNDVSIQLELEDLLAVLPNSAYEAVTTLFFGLDNIEQTSEILALTDFYPNDESELSGAMNNMSQFKMMMNDMIFSGPARLKAKQSQQMVTFYHFDYKPSFNVWTYNTKGENQDVDWEDALKSLSCVSGACHASELPFVFNKPFKLDGEAVSPSNKDIVLMNKLSRVWFSDRLFNDYQYSEATDSVMLIDQDGEIFIDLDWDQHTQEGVAPELRTGRLNGLENLGLLANYL